MTPATPFGECLRGGHSGPQGRGGEYLRWLRAKDGEPGAAAPECWVGQGITADDPGINSLPLHARQSQESYRILVGPPALEPGTKGESAGGRLLVTVDTSSWHGSSAPNSD